MISAIGIDIGGTNTVVGLVAGSVVLERRVMRTKGATDLDRYVKDIAHIIEAIALDYPHCNIVGIGIGAPNADAVSGHIYHPVNLPWKGEVPLTQLLTARTGLRSYLINDATAAVIGEMRFGNSSNLTDFMVITLGTGIGSGIVANGQLVSGIGGLAGELGHVIAVPGGRSCSCGRSGCLETYASATGLVNTAIERVRSGADTVLNSKPVMDITAEYVYNAALAGDAVAIGVFEHTGFILGTTLADVIALLAPQALVFMGGLAHAGDMLLVPVAQAADAGMLKALKGRVAFTRSVLPDSDAAILGAAQLVFDNR